MRLNIPTEQLAHHARTDTSPAASTSRWSFDHVPLGQLWREVQSSAGAMCGIAWWMFSLREASSNRASVTCGATSATGPPAQNEPGVQSVQLALLKNEYLPGAQF